MKRYLLLLLLLTAALYAEISVNKAEIINVRQNSMLPVFSADGNYLLYRSDDGLYTYDLRYKEAERFSDKGFDPVMDKDGQIRYRVDNYDGGLRKSSIELYDMRDKSRSTLIKSFRPDMAPKVTDQGVYYIET